MEVPQGWKSTAARALFRPMRGDGPVHRMRRRISHADVDFLGELKVSALLGMCEQAAVEASTEAGFDAVRYTEEGRVWIIRRTRLARFAAVGGGEEIELRTRVIDFRRARSLRHYEVWRGGEQVAEATTDWVYCDLLSGRPTRIPEALQRALYAGAPPTLARAEALPPDREEAATELAVDVRPSHLDHVRHVNNAVYSSFLEDGAFALFAASGWGLERMLDGAGALRLVRLDAEYVKDAVAGDALVVRSWLTAADGFDAAAPRTAELLQSIRRADGTEVLRATSSWRWRRASSVLGGAPE